MNEEQFQSILKTADILKKLENYPIKEADIINKGYCKYIKLVYSIINKCLKEFENDINIVDYIYKISSIYEKGEVYFIFNANNLSRIYLSINDGDNLELLVELEPPEISLHLIYTDDEYLFVKFNKEEEINDVILCNKKIKKRKTSLNNIYDIINDINKSKRQENCQILKIFKNSLNEIEKYFGK